MQKQKNNLVGKITLIFVAGFVLLLPLGCNKKASPSSTSKTIKKKKIKCSGCKARTASYSAFEMNNKQSLTKY